MKEVKSPGAAKGEVFKPVCLAPLVQFKGLLYTSIQSTNNRGRGGEGERRWTAADICHAEV